MGRQGPCTNGVWWTAAFVAVGLILSIQNRSMACDTYESIRIMTYNTELLMWPADDSYSLDSEQRAALVAQDILEDFPDIVILNEVFHHDAVDVLVEELGGAGKYPYYVNKLSGDNPGLLTATSGLMIFSRHPLGLLEDPPTAVSNVLESENPGHVYDVGFRQFAGEDLNGSDWMAYKGVGFVRIHNECANNTPYNIAFTHMQASYGDNDIHDENECFEDRQEELDDIREELVNAFSAQKVIYERTLMLGDLNIDGNLQGDQNIVYECAGGVCVPLQPHQIEWEHTFNSTDPNKPIDDRNHGFFSCRGVCEPDPKVSLLTDSWAFETSPLDDGGSTGGIPCSVPGECERLDYILHNNPTRELDGRSSLCLQHLTRGFARSFGLKMGAGHSDHMPVTANFNLPAPQCSPNHPTDPDLGPAAVEFDFTDPTDIDQSFPGHLTHPGSMQWYYIDSANPYDITIHGNHVAYTVYQGSDLSNPLPPWDGNCFIDPETEGYTCTFTMYNPPYYIRVFGVDTMMSDPDWKEVRNVGSHDYQIDFHRYICSSEDPCPLDPAVDTGPWVWPDQLLSPNAEDPEDLDTMFFVFTTEFTKAGQQPEITFLVDSDFPTNPNPLSMYLVDADGKLVCDPTVCPNGDGFEFQSPGVNEWDPDSDGDGMPDRLAAARDQTLPGDKHWTRRYFIKIRRDKQYLLTTSSIFMRYETSMNYFRPTYLKCDEERTDLGDDDLGGVFEYDTYVVNQWLPNLFDDGDFRTEWGTANWWFTWPAEFDASFISQMRPTMYEDVVDNDNFKFAGHPNNGDTIYPVTKEVRADPPIVGRYTWTDESDPDDAEYRYWMEYQLTHQRPACRNDSDCEPGDGWTCQNNACKQ